ncbi:hypothetical protein ANCCAN_25782 [Ancylostoma caninum]|uniref:Uncharacterized protein n=1 Tax=Ancylostoma caninum TaxID=29170 RepID=A0A368F8I9_ANCCA|nr:hypothetical protein ANCCAN_25782 [Ancylostoma caninum]
MVCVTRSSSKHEGAEAEDTIPPVRTRGRASTSRTATSTRRTRRTSAVEDSSNDAGANQGSEMSDHGSQASTGTESQRNSASPNPLTSTPSRRLRRKRGSETGSCGSSTSITDLQETSSAENPIAKPIEFNCNVKLNLKQLAVPLKKRRTLESRPHRLPEDEGDRHLQARLVVPQILQIYTASIQSFF